MNHRSMISNNVMANTLDSCELSSQLGWRYGEILFLSEVFVPVSYKNESNKMHFLFFIGK